MHPASQAPTLAWWRDPLLFAVAALIALWTAMAASWPLSGDAGVFAWMADTTLRGGRPYVDAWDTKGPGAWLPALVTQVLTGRNSWSIRLFDVAMLGVTLLSLRSIARHLGWQGHGRIAMALYATWYCGLDYWNSAQPDGWVGAWLIAASALAIAGGGVSLVAAGALVGLCTLVKPFYLGYVVVVGLLAVRRPAAASRSTTQRVGLACLGLIAAIALLVGLLSATHGLDGFRELQQWNREVYSGLGEPWLSRIPAALRGSVALPWGLVAPLALFGVISAPRDQRLVLAALAIGWLGAAAGVLLQGKLWLYHWLPMLPFYAILADAGCSSLVAGDHAGNTRRFQRVAVMLALAVAVLAPLQQLFRFARSRGSDERMARYEQHEFGYYGRYPGSLYGIVDSLAALEPGKARILTWTMHMTPQWLAGLRSPTEFAVIRPLYDGAGTSFRERYRARFLTGMRATPPRWWLVPSSALTAATPILATQALDGFPDAARLLRERYRRAASTSDWDVYELVPPVGSR